MKENNLIRITSFILFFCFNTEVVGQCADTLLYTPSANMVIQNKYTSKEDGFYINSNKVTRSYYIEATHKYDSILNYRWEKEKNGCYIVWFDEDSLRSHEGCFYIEYWIGIYTAYHKNGKLKERGEYSEKIPGAKISTWQYYNYEGQLMLEELYDSKGEKIDTRYY